MIPFVEKNYRVKNESKYRALAGLSMGGIQTLYVGINNTDMFSYLGVFSSGWIQPMQNNPANAQYEFMKNNAVPDQQQPERILDCHGRQGGYRLEKLPNHAFEIR